MILCPMGIMIVVETDIRAPKRWGGWWGPETEGPKAPSPFGAPNWTLSEQVVIRQGGRPGTSA